jgi:uncharacterized protein
MCDDRSFPLGIAVGENFCNRKEERARLAKNIKSGQHSLITSPRRYGKTSLVFYTINELGIPFGEADLFVSIDVKRIEQNILSGVKQTITKVSKLTEQTLNIIREYFKNKNAQWFIGTHGVNITLIPAPNTDHITNIIEALQALENLLHKQNKRAVLFLDEIQEMGEVAEGKGIEGAIRHVAQQTKHLAFVFSGSNRHLLSKMFYDKSRPLYKLCDRIVLERINTSEYTKHLNEFARKRWDAELDESSLNTIFELTELHPYYINNLCAHVWDMPIKKLPLASEITDCWHKIVKEERPEIIRELSGLSVGQRKVLITIADERKTKLHSKGVLQKMNLSSSTITEATQVLEQGDYIERLPEDGYRIIDPLLKTALNFYYSEV